MISNIKKTITNLTFAGVIALNLPSLPKLNITKFATDSAHGIKESTMPGSPIKGIEGKIEGKIRTAIQNFKNTRGTLSGQVAAVGSSTVTISSNGTSIQVDISSNTHIRRKFWGASNLGEISVGDSVEVVGKWISDAKTEITAVMVRDISIQKRFGVFFGTIKSLTSDGFVVTTIHRDDETVTIGSAKLIDRKGNTISSSDIQLGHKVRVRGMWNSTAKTITEVTEIKDFSLPTIASPSPTP
jgi:hypothetical protein